MAALLLLPLLPGCKRSSPEASQKEAAPAQAAPAGAASPGEQAAKPLLPATPAGILALLESGKFTLDAGQVTAALAYLAKPEPATTGQEPAAEYFNLIIGLLLAQPEPVKGFPEALMAAAGDTGMPVILRDYALQHFFHVWSRETNPGLKGQLEAQLKAEVADPHSPLQGTALLTSCRIFESGRTVTAPDGRKLRRLGSKSTETPPSRTVSYRFEEFSAAALAAATHADAKPTARASAFHSLLRLEVRSAIEPARAAARDPQMPEVIRCAAFAVVGNFGRLELDRELLEAVPIKPELVKSAADQALARLSVALSSH